MIFEIKGISFSYNSKPVLQELSLTLNAGEILGLIGPNGSGKSTLLKCMDNILKPCAGCILVDGKMLNEMKRETIAKKIGFVPQREGSRFPSTVFDAVLIGRKPHITWKPAEKDLKITTEIIKKLNISDIAMRDLDAISGGQRQKVFIARALVQEPEILLLDEPTNNLDMRHQLEVLDIVKKQTQTGVSAVIAIHDLNLAGRYCDKLVMLYNGCIFAAGGPEILHPDNIKPVYGVQASVLTHRGKQYVIPEYPE
ncbi:MAG: ABC transporter ATP-binding protein [Bacillota bacterium]